jgi:hypothetical protein
MAADRRRSRGQSGVAPNLLRALWPLLLARMKRVEEKRMCHFLILQSPVTHMTRFGRLSQDRIFTESR